MEVQIAKTKNDILKCWDVIYELRPHLDKNTFVERVEEMFREGYILAFIAENGIAQSAIGYRYENFLFCGKHFYIDDLTSLPTARGKGYAGKLLDFVANEAKNRGFEVITLDSGHARHTAHRLYLNKGFTISSHHFTKKL